MTVTATTEMTATLDKAYRNELRQLLHITDNDTPDSSLSFGKPYKNLCCSLGHVPRDLRTVSDAAAFLLAGNLSMYGLLDPYAAYIARDADTTRKVAASTSLEPVTKDSFGFSPASYTNHERRFKRPFKCPAIPINLMAVHTILRIRNSIANLYTWTADHLAILVDTLHLSVFAPPDALLLPLVVALALRQCPPDAIPPTTFQDNRPAAGFLHPSTLAISLSATGFGAVTKEDDIDYHDPQNSIHFYSASITATLSLDSPIPFPSTSMLRASWRN